MLNIWLGSVLNGSLFSDRARWHFRYLNSRVRGMPDYIRKITVTLYDELGLSPNVSPIELRERFILLAKATHPDLRGELADVNRFKRIIAANYVLNDYCRRRRYDEYLASCVDFNPLATELVDPKPHTSSDSSRKRESEPSPSAYRFSYGRKRENESAETCDDTDAPKPSGASHSTARKYTRYQSDIEQSVDSTFKDTHGTESKSHNEKMTFTAWLASRCSALGVKKPKRLPWADISAQLFAILFGAFCAGVIAHFVFLWLRPESGGLPAIFM